MLKYISFYNLKKGKLLIFPKPLFNLEFQVCSLQDKCFDKYEDRFILKN